MDAMSDITWQQLVDRLWSLPMPARRLLCVIVRQAHQGSRRSKAPGRATMPEIHEACGLDVDQMQELVAILKGSGLIAIEGAYPFEEIHLLDSSLWKKVLNDCEVTNIPLETAI